jgi:hypothetical protein
MPDVLVQWVAVGRVEDQKGVCHARYAHTLACIPSSTLAHSKMESPRTIQANSDVETVPRFLARGMWWR